MTVSLSLPLPPSTNGLFATSKSGHRFRSQIYDSWIKEAGWQLASQRPKKLRGTVSLYYIFEEPKTKRKMDLGNREKATTDLLVSHRIIEADDNTIVKRISLAWGPVEGVQITIVPHEAQE